MAKPVRSERSICRPSRPAARAGLELLAPHLIGEDPTAIEHVYDRMDRLMMGHPFVKSAIDMACWDILAQTAGMPLYQLLGGRRTETLPLFDVVSKDTPERMAEHAERLKARGTGTFQIKVGGSDLEGTLEAIRGVRDVLSPSDKLVIDGNGWLRPDIAIRLSRALDDVDLYLENPCPTYAECRHVKRSTGHPMKLDECVTDAQALVRAIEDDVIDLACIKLARVGGITKARQLRDLCIAFGVAVNVEDTWASDLGTMAVAHVAASTPASVLFATNNLGEYFVERTVEKSSDGSTDGALSFPQGTGLGCQVIEETLGDPGRGLSLVVR